jgi:hypothetical protein
MTDKATVPTADLLPIWQSHKRVKAAPIVRATQDEIVLQLASGRTHSVIPAKNMFARYMPVQGDYYVVYDDGYAAISPKKAFEDGYHAI